jgi:glycosyltransferase involved in cell wall biosynthesis
MKHANSAFRISIIVITKNRAETLRPCIQSILSQRPQFTELIIVDGSTDTKTVTLMRSFISRAKIRIRYIPEPKPGYATARNKGIEKAHCPWIAFIDDDCVLHKHWLYEMRQSIHKHPQAGACIGTTKTYYSLNPFALALQFYELLWKTPAIRGDRVVDPEILDTKNIVFSAQVFQKHHLRFRQDQYQEKLLSTDDIDMGMQVGASGCAAYVSSGAIVYHKDPTILRAYLRKLLFDRFSYGQFYKRWGDQRLEYERKRKPITKSILLDLLFSRYNTPWYLQLLVRATISITDFVLSI